VPNQLEADSDPEQPLGQSFHEEKHQIDFKSHHPHAAQ